MKPSKLVVRIYLWDRNGTKWLIIAGTPFLEDPDGERYTRSWVEQHCGPLTEKDGGFGAKKRES